MLSNLKKEKRLKRSFHLLKASTFFKSQKKNIYDSTKMFLEDEMYSNIIFDFLKLFSRYRN